MRSRDEDVPPGAAVERALLIGVCGIGGRLDPAPVTIDEALVRIDAYSGERVARRLERFASVPDQAFVWTRDIRRLLWLGRLSGPWRYDPAADAADVDLVHVRSCEWLDAIPHNQAPASVHATFARGGRNWQRIRATEAEAVSARVWEDRAEQMRSV